MISWLFPQRAQHHSNASTMTSFNDLPAEIRNMIYQLALTHNKPIDLSPHSSASKAPVKPNLLATSRRIRDEATPIFYGGNTFAVPSIKAAQNFVQHLGPQSVSSVRTLRVFAGFQLAIPAWMRDNHMKARLAMIDEMMKGCDGLTLDAVMIPALEEGDDDQWVRVKDVALEEKEQEEEKAPTTSQKKDSDKR